MVSASRHRPCSAACVVSLFFNQSARWILAAILCLSGTTTLRAASQINDDNPLQMPTVGSYGLRIISPTMLEVTLINSKEPSPARVSTWDFIADDFSASLPMSEEFSVIVGGQPCSVKTVGFKRRPLYAPLKQRDLRIANDLYLELTAAVADNQTVEVKNPNGRLWSPDNQFICAVAPLRFSPAIHVNQVGYAPNDPKKAMIGYYLGSLGELPVPSQVGFSLVDGSGVTVFRGALTRRLDVGYVYSPAPYQEVWQADFSAFTTPGEYRLIVPGLGSSYPFRIDEGTAAAFARSFALGLFHQRCGFEETFPFTRHIHAACHTAWADIPTMAFTKTQEFLASKTSDTASYPRQTAPPLKDTDSSLYPFVNQGKVDVSGGHHDAGDYSKYTINSSELIHYLVFAADSFPGVGGLDNLGIPESGDGKSDLLQEAKWEADYLAKMQDADGGFYFLVYPRDREYEDDVLPDHGDPQVVWPKTTSVTAAATAALAEIASSPLFKQQFPADAARYLQKAQAGWAFLQSAIAKYGKDGAYQKITHYGNEFMHDDELAWAAAAMFVATGDPGYQAKLLEWYDPADPNTRRWTWWRLFEGYGCAARTYAFAVRSGRLSAQQMDGTYLNKCQQEILAAAEDQVHFAQESAYGTSFPDLNKAFRSAGWYFSSERAFDVTVAFQLDPRPEFRETVVGNFNYEGGCNPVNVTYITGLGWKRQRDIVHQYAQNDHAVLPPSGLPLGNVQAGFAWLYPYQGELSPLAFPADGATSAPYPYYDRWGDSFNTTTEFVVMDQARCLASLSYWMAQSGAKAQSWRGASAQISGLPATISANQAVTATVQVAGVELQNARVVWEARDQEPNFGSSFRFTPKYAGNQWVEVEVQWPDGRRAFAATNFTATTSMAVPPNPYEYAPQTVTPDTIALFHLDDDEADSVAGHGSLVLSGNASRDTSNLGWMADRSGAALAFKDIGDKADITFPGTEFLPGVGGAVGLEAMIYVDQFVAWNRENVRILSLVEGWNSYLELTENLYEGPMIRGGTQFSVSGGTLTSALTTKVWHHLRITVDATGYSAAIDGVIVAQAASNELFGWGTSGPVSLELGNFSGWIDEVVIKRSAVVATPPPAIVAAPVVVTPQSTFANSTTLTLTTTTAGASIYYTLDGSTPTRVSTLYSTQLIITNSLTLKAVAVESGMTDSAVTTASFSLLVAQSQAVFVGVDTTTQGNWPSNYGADGYHIFDSGFSYPSYAESTTSSALSYEWANPTSDIRALQKPQSTDRIAACWYASPGFMVDLNFSDGLSHRVAWYFLDWDRLGRVETVDILDSATGIVLSTQTISDFQNGKYLIWNLKGRVTFRFTTLTGPNAVAMGIFFGDAPVVTAPPVILPGSGTFTNSVAVTLSSATAGATIRYTLDGTTPTLNSPVYSGPITISTSATLTARSSHAGMIDSAIATASFVIVTPVVSTPAIVPGGGTFKSPVTVTLSTATTGAAIRYTLNGTVPTETSPLYAGPFTVNKTMTVKAKAFQTGWTSSSVASAAFTITSGKK